MFWNRAKCTKCHHPMEVIYSNSWEGGNPGMPTQFGWSIKFKCLHCHNIVWENEGT